MQFTQNVPLETSIGPFNDQTPGLLTDLAGSPQLNGDLTLDTDLNVALLVGLAILPALIWRLRLATAF